jgi:hypothetical protein
MGYLRKFPRRGYNVNPNPPKFDMDMDKVKLNQDFGNQYHYFTKNLDPRFPEALVLELEINVFVDADHGHDKVTGRSVTGVFAFVGSTPVMSRSKRQASVQTSTFGAEFTALKTAVEDAVMLRYYLRSMGVKVTAPTRVLVDNMGVVLNSSNPGSTLNKKHIALAYHFVREHQAAKVISVVKIGTEDNYADPFTKGMGGLQHGDFFHNVMSN